MQKPSLKRHNYSPWLNGSRHYCGSRAPLAGGHSWRNQLVNLLIEDTWIPLTSGALQICSDLVFLVGYSRQSRQSHHLYSFLWGSACQHSSPVFSFLSCWISAFNLLAQRDPSAILHMSGQPWRDRSVASLFWSDVIYTPQHHRRTSWLSQRRKWRKSNDLYWLFCFPKQQLFFWRVIFHISETEWNQAWLVPLDLKITASCADQTCQGTDLSENTASRLMFILKSLTGLSVSCCNAMSREPLDQQRWTVRGGPAIRLWQNIFSSSTQQEAKTLKIVWFYLILHKIVLQLKRCNQCISIL